MHTKICVILLSSFISLRVWLLWDTSLAKRLDLLLFVYYIKVENGSQVFTSVRLPPNLQKIVKRHRSLFLVKFLQKNNVKEQGQQGRWSSSAIKRGRNPHHALSLKCFENTLKTSAHPAYEVLQTSMLNMINLYLHAFSRWPYWWISLDLPFLVLAFHPLIISCTYRKKVQGWFYRSIDFFTHFADQKPTTS